MITLGIITYNVQESIEQTLASAMAQTVPFSKIIIVDDGSTDKTVEKLQPFLNDDVILIEKENGGPSSARNRILDCVDTSYLCFLDGDDTVDDQFLEVIQKEMGAQGNREAYHYNFRDVFVSGKTVDNQYYQGAVSAQHQNKNGLDDYKRALSQFSYQAKHMVWSYCFNVEYLRNQQLRFDESLYIFEDIDFLFRFYQTNPSVVYIPQTLITYFHRDGSATSDMKNTRTLFGLVTLYQKDNEAYFQKYIQRLAAHVLPQAMYYEFCKQSGAHFSKSQVNTWKLTEQMDRLKKNRFKSR